MPELKLGKKPFVEDPQDFKLMELLATPLPGMPKRPFGHGSLFSDWGMLGNDGAGDCVWAGGDHEVMLWLALAGQTVHFTPKNALDDYGAVTGYPQTDDGTVVREAYGYRRNTGLVDVAGKRHKIDAYVQIDAKDWETMIRCVWTFGAVGIGFEFPQSAMQQFNYGEPWDVVPGSPIEGGHYVPVVGSKSPQKECTVITWGKKQRMTRAFYEEYNDEAWVPLSRESMLRSGFNARHIDWNTLNSMLPH